jgi:hypothetical protein
LVYNSPYKSFTDSWFRSFFMNLSFLTGVANAPLKLMVNDRITTIRILLLSWGITTIVLCSVYSSLVTTNVIAPKTIVSPWTDYKQLEKFTKVFGLNNEQEMLAMEKASKADKSVLFNRFPFAMGSKVSYLWFAETWKILFTKYKPKGSCNYVSGDSSTCQVFRKKSFEFLDSYRYAIRSDVEKLKEILSVCTNTAFIDTETSIDSFLPIWNQDERVPSMVKGSSFFQRSHTWTMSNTWLLRKHMSSRMKTFTTAGIIGFWERYCVKHCKKQSEPSELQNSVMNSTAMTFKPQKLGSNIISLFLILLTTFTISILCLLGERFCSLAHECCILFLSYRTYENLTR